jgi:amino acid adenylation domain-containing protein
MSTPSLVTRRLHEYASRQAESRPDAVAVTLRGTSLTYAALDTMSSKLARVLQEGGCEPGDRVCILIPKSPMAIVAMHAIMKAGGIYVPIDVSSPAARVTHIISASDPRWLLATSPSSDLIDGIMPDAPGSRPRVGWLEPEAVHGQRYRAEFDLEALEAAPAAALPVANAPDAAHILFTSGSTGIPKGVVIDHANVIAFVEWGISYFGMGQQDRVSGHSPFAFDLSTFDIYGALASGAELHLVPPELNLLPTKIVQFIRESGLTQWFSVPSLLTYIASLDGVQEGDLPELKRLIWCGEVFPTASLIHWMQKLPDVAFTNLYGPTEATIASSYYTLPSMPADPTASVPIGVPCAGEQLLVLDDDLSEVPDGEVGDLYIAGVGLSPGYWRNAEATSAAFRDRDGLRIYRTGDLATRDGAGLVYFHGRKDTQVKSRGHRIELGEIETALATLPELREGAVVGIPSTGFEGTTICCAYVPIAEEDVSPRTIRASLSELIPTYMVPTRWLAFEQLPKNSNGKVDKNQLKERFLQSP